MSKYDVEVEGRLKQLEGYVETLSQQVAELQDHVNDHEAVSYTHLTLPTICSV